VTSNTGKFLTLQLASSKSNHENANDNFTNGRTASRSDSAAAVDRRYSSTESTWNAVYAAIQTSDSRCAETLLMSEAEQPE
jgi:hypothetical protein